MPRPPLGILLAPIRTLAGVGGQGEPSDRELVERFVSGREDAAFAGLVGRHGSLVWGVCRRVLRHVHDAEDAFQATFVVLARKAATLRGRESIGPWLYHTAWRIARHLRADAVRRRDREPLATRKDSEDPQAEVTWREVRGVLDEELGRLPERYRAPLVLCYLAGRTRDEAARQLGWSPGAVKGRLERGRELLRRRLLRRGISLSAVLLGGLLVPEALAEAVPAVLGVATLRLALAAQRSAAALPAGVAAVLRGTSRALATARLKMMLAVVLVAGVVLAAGGTLLRGALPAASPEAAQAPASAGSGDPAGPASRREGPSRVDRYGDPLPEGAVARLGTVRYRMGGGIVSAGVSADGKTILAGGWDRTLRLFDVPSGKVVRELRAGPDTPNFFDAVALAPDGKTAAATSAGLVLLWDMTTGKQVALLKGHERFARLFALAFSPNGKHLVSGGEDKTLRVWDVAGRRELCKLEGHERNVNAVAFSSDGKRLVSAGEDHTLRVWEPAAGKPVRTLQGPRAVVLSLALSRDGKRLVTGSGDDVVRFWDVAAGKEVCALKGHRHPVEAVALSADGKTIASGGGYTVRLWDAGTGKEQKRLEGHRGSIHFLAFHSDRRLLSAGDDKTIRLWDVTSGKELQVRHGHAAAVHTVACSPDGRYAATGGDDWLVRLWDLSTRREVRRFHQAPGLQDRVEALAFSPDGKTLAGVAYLTLYLWDVATGKEVSRLRTDNRARCSSLAFSPDGKTLATGHWDRVVRLWDVGKAKEVRRFAESEHIAWKVAYSPDGKTVASLAWHNDKDGSVCLWDPATGKRLRRLEGAKGCAGELAFSPDGRLLGASAGNDAVRLWEARTGRRLRTVRLTDGEYPLHFPFAFSPDGRKVAIPSTIDNTVHVVETATGGRRCRFAGHRGPIRSVTFTPDGKRLLTASDDTSALVWDVTGRLSAVPRKKPLTEEEVKRLWADLGGKDAGRAHRAIFLLVESPEKALPLVKKHLRPTKAADAKRLAAWLRDLDSETFAVRKKATEELATLGDAAEQALRRELEGRPPLETRKRLQQLLDRLADDSPRRLLQGRALEMLELTGTAEARELLRELAGGAPGAWLTEEAKAVRKGMGK